ncbi:hypothetical protein F4805DRAFT_285790 [Annulohypoxylon moriforme]|nr:hypothetical protein F4805DRAFT_285790 [Annulohypoxylon moriforme]
MLSHFFWKLGSKMQNSIKGFLCSILHQALRYNTELLDSILAATTSLLSKESYDDWSLKELKNTCLAVLTAHPSSLCILIDGLDEICSEDGPISLLGLIDHIKGLPNVKLCVSSRPEPLLCSSLSKHQQLRLQDLTRSDMWRYSNATIGAFSNQITDSDRQKITRILVEKAEGVFLWLHLATGSLIRGLGMDDTIKVLYQRLEEMPNELSSLYSDMWKRMNGDTKLYRRVAALYFNLLITQRGDLDAARRKYPWIAAPVTSVFLLMAATEPQVQEVLVDRRETMDLETLERLCKKVYIGIIKRCAGLVEIKGGGGGTEIGGRGDEPLSYYKGVRVEFIHRTAYDYLMDTEGLHIRKYDPSSLDTRYIMLAKGNLLAGIIFPGHSRVSDCLEHLSKIRDQSLQESINHILRVTYNCYKSVDGLFQDFAASASCPAFSAVILSMVATSQKPAFLATIILREALFSCHQDEFDFFGDQFRNPCSFVEQLLLLGADLGYQGIGVHDGPYDCILVPRGRTPMLYLSPFEAFVASIFDSSMALLNVPTMYEVLEIFIKKHPDLKKCLPITIKFDKDYMRTEFFSLYTCNEFDSQVSRTMRSGAEMVIMEDDLCPVAFIFDLNLASLVMAACEYGRKQNFPISSTSAFGYDLIQAYAQDHNVLADPGNNIAFMVFRDRLGGHSKCFQLTRQHFTHELLGLLLQRLYGDESQNLCRAVYQHAIDIVHDIQNNSVQPIGVYGGTGSHKKPQSLWDKIASCLADKNCGYTWICGLRSIQIKTLLCEKL